MVPRASSSSSMRIRKSLSSVACVVLIIALVSYVAYDTLTKQANERASAAFSAASDDIPALRTVIDEHSGKSAAGAALFRIAQKQWEDQSQQEAIATLESFIADKAGHPLFINAQATLASYQLQMGEIEKAKALYAEVERAGTGHELYPIALLSLGDIARRQGDNDSATSYYERVNSEFAERNLPGLKNLASARLELVGVDDPTPKPKELPKPPPIPTNPAMPKTPQPAISIPAVPAAETKPTEVTPPLVPVKPETITPPEPANEPQPEPTKPAETTEEE